jgi:hypothetical protein
MKVNRMATLQKLFLVAGCIFLVATIIALVRGESIAALLSAFVVFAVAQSVYRERRLRN